MRYIGRGEFKTSSNYKTHVMEEIEKKKKMHLLHIRVSNIVVIKKKKSSLILCYLNFFLSLPLYLHFNTFYSCRSEIDWGRVAINGHVRYDS